MERQKHRIAWEAEEPLLKSIQDTSEGEEKFALGCAICMAYKQAHPDSKLAKKCQLATGSLATVKKDVLVRHFGHGIHKKALKWQDRKAHFSISPANGFISRHRARSPLPSRLLGKC